MKILLCFLTIILTAFNVHAQKPKMLDTSFGKNGLVTTSTHVGPDKIKSLPNGKLLVSGGINDKGSVTIGTYRYLPDGSIDKTFGTNGFAKIFSSLIEVRYDGKIVAAGSSNNQVYLSRYSSEGIIDTGFGKNGTYSFKIPYNTGITSIAFQEDGKIILAGNVYFNETDGYTTAAIVMRFNVNGGIDKYFADSGYLVMNDQFNSKANSVAIQTDGKIVIAGSMNVAPLTCMLARFNVTGSRDKSFGDYGVVLNTFKETNQQYNSIAIQPDGKIVAGGYYMYKLLWNYMLVARYNTNGSLDKDFAKDGWKTISFGKTLETSATALKVLLQHNNKIVLTGYEGVSAEFNYALARVYANGNLDSSFGINGLSATDLGHKYEVATDAALQPNGKIVIAGSNQEVNNILIARYYGDPVKYFPGNHK